MQYNRLLRYQPLSGTVKPCRGNAVFLVLLSVCGSGTWESLSLLLDERFQLGGFCFHTAASFLKHIRKKFCHDSTIHHSIVFIKCSAK